MGNDFRYMLLLVEVMTVRLSVHDNHFTIEIRKSTIVPFLSGGETSSVIKAFLSVTS